MSEDANPQIGEFEYASDGRQYRYSLASWMRFVSPITAQEIIDIQPMTTGTNYINYTTSTSDTISPTGGLSFYSNQTLNRSNRELEEDDEPDELEEDEPTASGVRIQFPNIDCQSEELNEQEDFEPIKDLFNYGFDQ